VAANLRDFYRRGTLWCVLDAMTLGGGPDAILSSVRAAYPEVTGVHRESA